MDRGAWGLEVLLVMIAWKLAFPRQVVLLRGAQAVSHILLNNGCPLVAATLETQEATRQAEVRSQKEH